MNSEQLIEHHMDTAGNLGETRAAFKLMVSNFDQLLAELVRVTPVGVDKVHPVRMLTNSRDRLIKMVEDQQS